MASTNTGGPFGGDGGTPCGSKRPGDSLVNGTGSAKRPKIVFGVPGDASAAPAGSLWGSSDASDKKLFGGANTSATATGSVLRSNSPSGARPFGETNKSSTTSGGLFGPPASSTTGAPLGTPTPAATPSYLYGPPIPWGYLAPAQALPMTPNGGFPGSFNGFFPFTNSIPTGGTRTPFFPDAASLMKSNVTPQPIQETINTATRPSPQGLAAPQDETNKKFEDLATQVRKLKRQLETFEKGATPTKRTSTPARPQVSLTTAEGYLAWLQQLDLRTPEGITDWKKAEVGVAGQCLVKFGNLDLILVTQGGLHEPFELNEDTRDSSPVKEEPGLVQELCHAGCVELTLTTGGHLAAEIPKYLLQLGSVYRKPKSRDTLSPPVMAARLYMDITKPSKSLWLVRLGLGGSTTMSFSRTFDLGDDGSVTFDVAKLVDDISTLETSDLSDPILADQEQVTRTLKKSAHLIVTSFQNAKLIKPKPYELEHAIRTGWAENYGA